MDVGELRVRLRTALESRRAVPPDVSEWLLAGMERQGREGCSLDEALGFKVGRGEAWRHPVRQRRRAEIEASLLLIADLAGGRGSREAGLIAESLQGVRHRLPGEALDRLFRLCRMQEREITLHGQSVVGGRLPTSRSAILQILRGETAAQRDGAVPGALRE